MEALYPDDFSMAEARARYFAVNGFGPTGGYGDAWVELKLGPLALAIPNTEARVRAVRYHDLHHILTEYSTDFVGEFEIGAWEVGAGCKDYGAAWVLNLAGMAGGLLVAPRRTFRAFVRGRGERTLYGEPLDALLAETVGEVRARVCNPGTDRKMTPVVMLWFVAACLLGFVLGVPLAVVGLAASPGLLLLDLARRARRGLARRLRKTA